MAVATIKLVAPELLGSFYFTKNPADLASKLLREGHYKVLVTLCSPDLDCEAVADKVYGQDWLCCSQS